MTESLQLIYFGITGENIDNLYKFINSVTQNIARIFQANNISIDIQPYPRQDNIFVENENVRLANSEVQYKCQINQNYTSDSPTIQNIIETGKRSQLYNQSDVQIIISIPPQSYIDDVLETESILEEMQQWFLITDDNSLYKLNDLIKYYQDIKFSYAKLHITLRQRQIINSPFDKTAQRSMAEHPRQPMQLFYPLQGFDGSFYPSNRLRMHQLAPPVMKKVEGTLLDRKTNTIIEMFGNIMRESSQEQIEQISSNIPFKHYIQKTLINVVSYFSIKDSIKNENNDNFNTDGIIDENFYIVRKSASDRYLQKQVSENQRSINYVLKQQTEVGLRDYFIKRRRNLLDHCISQIAEASNSIQVKTQQIQQTKKHLQTSTKYVLIRPGAITRSLFLDPDAHDRLDQQLGGILRGRITGFYVFCQDNCYIDSRKFLSKEEYNVIFQLYLSQIDKSIYSLIGDLTSDIELIDNRENIKHKLAQILSKEVENINFNQNTQDINMQVDIKPNNVHNQNKYQVQCPDNTINNDFLDNLGQLQTLHYKNHDNNELVNKLRHIYLNQQKYEPDALYMAAVGIL